MTHKHCRLRTDNEIMQLLMGYPEEDKTYNLVRIPPRNEHADYRHIDRRFFYSCFNPIASGRRLVSRLKRQRVPSKLYKNTLNKWMHAEFSTCQQCLHYNGKYPGSKI